MFQLTSRTSPVIAPFASIDDVLASDEEALGDFGVVAYQGAKRRYAEKIVDAMERRFGKATTWGRFFDLCCGTGAVATEVARRAPKLTITVVDLGPWGRFWAEYGKNKAGVISALRRAMPDGTSRGTACRRLLGKPVGSGAAWAGAFLAVQGGTLYGRIPGDWRKRWRTTCVLPTAGGHGAERVVEKLMAVPPLRGVHGRAEDQTFRKGDVVYIDPDYVGTSGYQGNHCPVPLIATKVLKAGGRLAVSHHMAYPGVTGPTVTITANRCMTAGTKKGAGQDCKREVLIFVERVTAAS